MISNIEIKSMVTTFVVNVSFDDGNVRKWRIKTNNPDPDLRYKNGNLIMVARNEDTGEDQTFYLKVGVNMADEDGHYIQWQGVWENKKAYDGSME